MFDAGLYTGIAMLAFALQSVPDGPLKVTLGTILAGAVALKAKLSKGDQ